VEDADPKHQRRWPGRTYLIIAVGTIIYLYFAIRTADHLSLSNALAPRRNSPISDMLREFEYWTWLTHGLAILLICGLLLTWQVERQSTKTILRLLGFYLFCEGIYLGFELMYFEFLVDAGVPVGTLDRPRTARTGEAFITWQVVPRAAILVASITLLRPWRIGGALALIAFAISLPLTASFHPKFDPALFITPDYLYLHEPNWARFIIYGMCVAATLLHKPIRDEMAEAH